MSVLLAVWTLQSMQLYSSTFSSSGRLSIAKSVVVTFSSMSEPIMELFLVDSRGTRELLELLKLIAWSVFLCLFKDD